MTGQIPGVIVQIRGDHRMKKIRVVAFLFNAFVGVCLAELPESLDRHFEAVIAKTNGLLIVFNTNYAPYMVSVKFDDPGKIRHQGKSSELGEYFVPYEQRWNVSFAQRDTRVVIQPLDADIDRKGFFIRDIGDGRSGGQKLIERTGILLYLDAPSSDGRSYEIVDEKKYINNQLITNSVPANKRRGMDTHMISDSQVDPSFKTSSTGQLQITNKDEAKFRSSHNRLFLKVAWLLPILGIAVFLIVRLRKKQGNK